MHPREISFTAARRAIITATRSGAATASWTEANGDKALASLTRRRILVDRNRHRDRKTKARPGLPPAGPRLPGRTAPAEISICGTLGA
jgi:hypothetical protein